MFGFGKKRQQAIEVFRPVPGRVMMLEEVGDPVFSQKMMGDGFAVEPVSGDFAAPISGELVLLFPTKHAFAVRSAEGVEVLVHIGVDTVNLNGEGFASTKNQGDHVERGEIIVAVDMEQVADKVPSLVTPVIITNGADFKVDELKLDADADEAPLTVVPA